MNGHLNLVVILLHSSIVHSSEYLAPTYKIFIATFVGSRSTVKSVDSPISHLFVVARGY